MKTIIHGLHKVFESRVRLGIMSALAVNEKLDFNTLKDYLQVTDGNLANHIKALEKEKFIDFSKTFIERKPNTSYHITNDGREAFKSHLKALEEFLRASSV